jgi:hypothetical protein
MVHSELRFSRLVVKGTFPAFSMALLTVCKFDANGKSGWHLGRLDFRNQWLLNQLRQ